MRVTHASAYFLTLTCAELFISCMSNMLWPLVTEEFNKKSVNLENIVNFGNLLNVLAFSFSILHFEIYSQ